MFLSAHFSIHCIQETWLVLLQCQAKISRGDIKKPQPTLDCRYSKAVIQTEKMVSFHCSLRVNSEYKLWPTSLHRSISYITTLFPGILLFMPWTRLSPQLMNQKHSSICTGVILLREGGGKSNNKKGNC